jgi:hypothetical protein
MPACLPTGPVGRAEPSVLAKTGEDGGILQPSPRTRIVSALASPDYYVG